MRIGLFLSALICVAALGGCGGQEAPVVAPSPAASPTATRTASLSASPSPTPSPSAAATPTPSPTAREVDPRWQFFTDDRSRYASDWFRGRHRIMIPYGCNAAPFYDPDPSCPGGQGFHHGIDVAMPCGTPLLAGASGVVLEPGAPGTPGPAYGERPFRLRVAGQDVLIGHARRVFVSPGDRVRAGQRLALASDSAAPDGCHLHFEVRAAGGGVSDAVDPGALLGLR